MVRIIKQLLREGVWFRFSFSCGYLTAPPPSLSLPVGDNLTSPPDFQRKSFYKRSVYSFDQSRFAHKDMLRSAVPTGLEPGDLQID